MLPGGLPSPAASFRSCLAGSGLPDSRVRAEPSPLIARCRACALPLSPVLQPGAGRARKQTANREPAADGLTLRCAAPDP